MDDVVLAIPVKYSMASIYRHVVQLPNVKAWDNEHDDEFSFEEGSVDGASSLRGWFILRKATEEEDFGEYGSRECLPPEMSYFVIEYKGISFLKRVLVSLSGTIDFYIYYYTSDGFIKGNVFLEKITQNAEWDWRPIDNFLLSACRALEQHKGNLPTPAYYEKFAAKLGGEIDPNKILKAATHFGLTRIQMLFVLKKLLNIGNIDAFKLLKKYEGR